MKKILYQHGDVLLEVVESMPTGGKIIKPLNGYVLERGEGTNAHTLTALTGELFDSVDMIEKDGYIYFHVKKPVVQNHPEHGPQTIETGKIIRKIIEREWDLEKALPRKVVD